MDKILHTVAGISQPLGIAGVLAFALFLISRQIIKKNIFPTLTQNRSAAIITLIINRLSLLTLIAIILGFAGYAINLIYQSPVLTVPLVRFQNVIFRGHVIDARTARVVTGAKITIKAQDKTLTDESDSYGAFVIKLQLPVDDLTVDLKVEANNYISFSEHQVLATISKSVSLAAIESAQQPPNDSKTNQRSNSVPATKAIEADRTVAGIEIAYSPSSLQWSRISAAFKTLVSPSPEISYSMAALSAERIRGYWVINFEPIPVAQGMFQFAQVSTDDIQNRRFEDVVKAALIPLSVNWDGTEKIRVDYSQGSFPASVKISKDRIALIWRPPETMLSASTLKQNPTITLRGEGDISNLTIRSLDPGVVLNQNLNINWIRDSAAADPANTMSHVAGPYELKVDLTPGSAAVADDESQFSESGSCPSGVCGGMVCTPYPGYCLNCGSCGAVCCPADKNSQERKVVPHRRTALSVLLLWLVLTFTWPW